MWIKSFSILYKTLGISAYNYLSEITDFSTLELPFAVPCTSPVMLPECELVPNGSNILLNSSNKEEYIWMMYKWRMRHYETESFDLFIKGFHNIVHPMTLHRFLPGELLILMAGEPHIDVQDWKGNTLYREIVDGYAVTAAPAKADDFWKMVDSLSVKEQTSLLEFVTASSRPPAGGFQNLNGGKFTIEFSKSVEDLPTSRTCFNTLILPAYGSYEELSQKFSIILNIGIVGFGFA